MEFFSTSTAFKPMRFTSCPELVKLQILTTSSVTAIIGQEIFHLMFHLKRDNQVYLHIIIYHKKNNSETYVITKTPKIVLHL